MENPEVNNGEKVTVAGTVIQIIYHNADNDYTVLDMLTDASEELVAVGNMPFVHEEDQLILYGRYTTHKTHGLQFAVEAYEKRLPQDTEAILQYLSSKNVKGVGPVTALKIVNHFGIDSFDVIEHHPEWLTDIAGITPKKAAEINRSFCEQTGIRTLLMFCRDYFSGTAITKIFRRFGSGAVDIIKENPYCLCEEIDGVDFPKSDKIALDLGFDASSEMRISAGIRYVLHYNASQNGHTCMPTAKLRVAAAALLGLPEEKIVGVLDSEGGRKKFSRYFSKAENEEYIYSEFFYTAENRVIESLYRLKNSVPALSVLDAERLCDRVEAERGIVYAARQREAIYASLCGGIMILTGGPGTGKTTVIQALIRIFDSLGFRTALAAPTGRAAKRMSEATGEEAKTIHRMLEMEKGEDDSTPVFKRREDNPLEEKVIIVDEASMLDLSLFDALLRAIPRGGRLVLIGDTDQLPSVGAGNVLRDLVGSDLFSTVTLNEIFRQSESSLIVTNAHRINEGEMPDLSAKDKDFFFLSRPNERQIPDTVVSLLSDRLPKAYGAEIVEKIQVITPSRRGIAGTDYLNRVLQSALNPPSSDKAEHARGETVFRVGDRVMQTRNDYEIQWQKNGVEGYGIYNGDIGEITAIERKSETLTVDFDGRIAVYEFSDLEEIEHAYAITVHKSQGCEYGTVLIPLYSCPPMLITRNLLYTAVTRACDRVILIGKEEILDEMVRNNRIALRYTLLAERLSERFSE